jgi:hypothetical protein
MSITVKSLIKSLDLVHFFDSSHKSANANFVVIYCNSLTPTVLLHELLGSIVDSIEFTDLIRVADALKEVSNVLSEARKLEIKLRNAKLLEC